MQFIPFDYKNPPEDGLLWVCVSRQEWDGDTGNDGQAVGTPTGNEVRTTALVNLETDPDGTLRFDPVDEVNFGEVGDDGVVTHYAEVVPPALPVA